MVEPTIAARMEQAHYFTSLRINPGQIRAFPQVRTGESEIVRIVITTMLARSNVLYVEAQFGKFLREPAILTALARPRTDKLAQLDIHQLRGGGMLQKSKARHSGNLKIIGAMSVAASPTCR